MYDRKDLFYHAAVTALWPMSQCRNRKYRNRKYRNHNCKRIAAASGRPCGCMTVRKIATKNCTYGSFGRNRKRIAAARVTCGRIRVHAVTQPHGRKRKILAAFLRPQLRPHVTAVRPPQGLRSYTNSITTPGGGRYVPHPIITTVATDTCAISIILSISLRKYLY